MTNIDIIKEYTQNGKEIPQDKLDYLTSNKRLKGYIGPRQCGKTYLLYQDLISNAFTNPGDYLVIAPNFPVLRIIQQHIEKCLKEFLLDFEYVSVSPNCTIKKMQNGSTVTFISNSSRMEAEYLMRGKRNYKAVYIDEPRAIDSIFNMIDLLKSSIAQECGYISVFGTINKEFAEELKSIGFKLTYNTRIV